MDNDIGGVWRTIGGRRVFIKTGQSLTDAMKKSGKFKVKRKEDNKYNDSYESVEKATETYDLDSTATIDKRAKEFYDKIGYGEKPSKVSEAEFEKLAKESKYGVLERGYRGSSEEQIQDYMNQFKDGDLYIGMQRGFGAGTYFGYGKDAHATAHRYGQQNDKNILKATIDKNAKVVDSFDLQAKRNEYNQKAITKALELDKQGKHEEASKYFNKMNKIMVDDGVFAASLGYDAIDVKDAGYIVILNRKRVYVSER